MSIRKNFLYSSLLTVSNYLFPVLVYPYVSRVLGLSSIGVVNFVDNIINYFVLISMMGISTVGVREIAASRNNRLKLNQIYTSLLTLVGMMTIISDVLLVVLMHTVPALMPYRDLLYVGLVKLSFNLFLIEWFFMGIEDFRYITSRSILVKLLYVVCIFLFVRSSTDCKIYYIISVAMVVVNAFINIIYSHRFVDYDFKSISLRPFVVPFFIMGIYVLLTNIYTSLNVVWLGFVTDTDEVGCFTTATKLYTIIMAVLTSFTNILFPRVSNLVADGNQVEYWQKIDISFDAIFLFSFPTMIFMITSGPNLLHLLVGDGYEGAYLPLRIITPLVLIIGMEQILVTQILMAQHCDRIVLRNSFIGAIISLLFNAIITSKFGASGSSIVWVLAECTIALISIISIRKLFSYIIPYQKILKHCFAYAPLLIFSIFLLFYLKNGIINFLINGSAIIMYSFIIEVFFLKNRVAVSLFYKLSDCIRL